jgi:MFS family permease
MSEAIAVQSPPAAALNQNRTYRLILAGHLISILGDGFHSVALSLWVLQVTGSAKAMSAVMGVRIIVAILLGAFAGAVVDRSDRRRLMWTMDLLRGVLVIGMAVAVASGMPFPVLLLLIAVLTAAGQFRSPAFSASLVHIVGKERVQKATSVMQMLSTGMQVIAPLLGGAVAAGLGGWVALMGDAASFFLCALLVLAAGSFPSPRRERGEKQPFWEDMRGGIRYIRGDAFLTALIIMAPLVNMFTNAAGVLTPVVAYKVWAVSPAQFGLVEGVIPLGFALGAAALTAFGSKLRKRGLLIGGITVLGGLLYLLMGLVPSVWMAYPLLLLMGMVYAVTNVLIATALQTQTAPEMQGRVFGTLNSLLTAASPLALAVAGTVADLYNPALVLAACGVGLGAMGGLATLLLRGLRRFD